MTDFGWFWWLFEELRDIWPQVVAVLHTTLALWASIHAILTKDEPRAAVGWVGLIWLSPFLGATLYYLLGINRIRRKAVAIKPAPEPIAVPASSEELVHLMPEPHFVSLVHYGDQVVGRPLTRGNRVTPLLNGDEAYPAMLQAIRDARTSIMLSSYIFDNDAIGKKFVQALGEAVARGVEVRVLIDATGSRYSFPTVIPSLQQVGVRVARFMPGLSPARIAAFNLRSHRKILVVDGVLGFTGGMNIRMGHVLGMNPPRPIQDLHFQVEGPVISHVRQAFIEDWAFTTKEVLDGPTWLPPLEAVGAVLARGVLDGPDHDFEKILWMLLGAITRAKSSIKILTPYFLPEPTTARFLSVAALAGIDVEVIVPEACNIKLVQWASMAVMPSLLASGVRVYQSPPPFDHSKMMVVDNSWVFIGSANWDTRSLRLNFEFNIECYSAELAARLSAIFDAKRQASTPLTLLDLARRGYARRLRDGAVRLLAPYL